MHAVSHVDCHCLSLSLYPLCLFPSLPIKHQLKPTFILALIKSYDTPALKGVGRGFSEQLLGVF